jgi:tetratricopeptide (TPR) repeat protein
MAIDKSRTSPLMKTGIILLSAVFVLGIGFAGLSGLQSCTPSAPLLPGGSSASTESTTTETTQTLAAKYTPQVQALEASLTVDPKSYDLLVQQADTYFSWAYDLQKTMSSQSTTANPVWATARDYYQRAVAVKATDASTLGDYAITLFYTGDTAAAISMGEKARALDPALAQNLFNLGNYYATAGQNVKAIDAFKAYLSKESTGQQAQEAQQNIKALGGS